MIILPNQIKNYFFFFFLEDFFLDFTFTSTFLSFHATKPIAISHIIPQYAAPISEEMIKEAIDKTEEEIDFAVLDWKGLGLSEQRQSVIDILEKNYISWKKTSEVNK